MTTCYLQADAVAVTAAVNGVAQSVPEQSAIQNKEADPPEHGKSFVAAAGEDSAASAPEAEPRVAAGKKQSPDTEIRAAAEMEAADLQAQQDANEAGQTAKAAEEATAAKVSICTCPYTHGQKLGLHSSHHVTLW